MDQEANENPEVNETSVDLEEEGSGELSGDLEATAGMDKKNTANITNATTSQNTCVEKTTRNNNCFYGDGY